MSAEERDPGRLAHLERRIATLEVLVRELAVRAGLGPGTVRTPAEPARPAPAAPARPPQDPPGQAPPLQIPPEPEWDLEHWFGAKGLLLVGVVALIAATGFFLNYAFERGWVPPLARALGAVLAGFAVAGLGERQLRAGLRRYGLGLIGAGAGLIYLGIWAAAGPYQLIDRRPGVLLFALVSAALSQRAADHGAQALALWALLGAFLAPVFLPVPSSRPELLLGYLGVVGHAAVGLAVRQGWRGTAGVALLGYFALASLQVPWALSQPLGLAYLALGGITALITWRRTGWDEVRVGGVLLGWPFLLVYASRATPGVAESVALAVGTLWLVLEWLHALSVRELADHEPVAPRSVTAFGFYAAPFAWMLLALMATPSTWEPWAGMPLAVGAALYLAGGWPGRRAAFVLAGFGLLAFAAVRQLDAVSQIVGTWCGLILLAHAAGRWRDQRAGPAVALLLSGAAGLTLFTWGLGLRESTDAALLGPWALALYAYLAATILVALTWRSRIAAPGWLQSGRGLVWIMVGLAVFLGGSVEIQRFWSEQLQSSPTARLAADLSLSVFWLLYAGLMVWLGFRLDRAAVRGPGLAVAALAAAKIAFYDLGRLEALFRVGSFFVLALLALAVAWAYNRKTRRTLDPT